MKRKDLLRMAACFIEFGIQGICAAIGFILLMAAGLLVYSIVFG